MENKKISVSFAAIDKYIGDNIIENEQKEIKGKNMVEYGQKNIFPNYVYNLYENVSILKSVIDGLRDYICGSNITINKPEYKEHINDKGETIEDIVKQMAQSYMVYGGIALNIVRNRLNGIAGIYVLDFKCVRSDKKNTKFYYSEDWANKSLGRINMTVYPAYKIDGKDASSIFYYKDDNYKTYPSPKWGAAVVSAEILKHINEFNLNNLYNGLSSDYIVNMNAGVPADPVKEEIEENFSEKYTGFQNGGRTMICYNPDFQHRTTVEALPQSSFIDKYNAIRENSIKDVYSAFRVHPVLFGLPTDNSGFNDQDFQEAYKLAQATVVLPVQKEIKRIFEKIFGEKEVVTIEPFNIDWSEEEDKNLVK